MEPGRITLYLEQLRSGDEAALHELVPLLYAELRRVAQSHLQYERADHTLSATALVHEAYLRLSKQRQIRAEDRVQFLGVAGGTMRRILVDWARAKKRDTRGGGAATVPLEEADQALTEAEAEEVLALDDALSRLGQASERGAKVVECRFFAGLSVEETAVLLGISTRTVQREWTAARAWLRKEIDQDLQPEPPSA